MAMATKSTRRGSAGGDKPLTDLPLSLRGVRGNAGAIMLRARKTLRHAHRSDLTAAFTADCLKGDYVHLIATCRRYFVVSG